MTAAVPTQIAGSKEAQYVVTVDTSGAYVAGGGGGASSANLQIKAADGTTDTAVGYGAGNLNVPVEIVAGTIALTGEDHIGSVGGSLVTVTATFTRMANATPYTAGDVVSNDSTTTVPMTFANFARIIGGSGYIVGARLSHEIKSIVPRFRVHLYNAVDPTVAGDNLAHKHVYADVSKRIGWFDLAAMTTGADTTNSDESRSLDLTIRIPFVAAASTRSIFAVLECLDGFTPGNAKGVSLTLLGDLN